MDPKKKSDYCGVENEEDKNVVYETFQNAFIDDSVVVRDVYQKISLWKYKKSNTFHLK